ncbi:MAG: PH domain-containing protein [Prosthecobacter sp.]|nr:PH domain-containing protein [Prosthecobacter sp.]
MSRQDLYLLVDRGSISRGELCTDIHTSRDHTVGEVISGMAPPRPRRASRLDRPSYREFRADLPPPSEPEPPPEELTFATEDESDIVPAEETVPEASAQEPAPDENLEDEEELPLTGDGERVFYMAHPSWLSYGKPLSLALALFSAAVGLQPEDEGWAIVAALCGIAVLIATSIARRSHDYVVTDERVEHVWGILGRSSKEVRICDIRSLDVTEKGLSGLLGLGTLDISSASTAGVEVRFLHLRRAHEVKKIIRRLQRSKTAD